MAIVLGYIVFCSILATVNPNHKKFNIIVMFLLLTYIAGYRDVTFTEDNVAYANYYNYNSVYDLDYSFKNVINNIGKDPFYYFVGNVFSKLGFSYRGWFVFIAAIYNGGFFYLIYKRSHNYLFSIIFLICLSYFYFSMTGLRQAVAMGFLFFALDAMLDNRILRFSLFVLLAFLFHSSAIMFFLLYFIRKVRVGPKHYLVILLSAFIALIIPSFASQMISRFAWNEDLLKYADVTTGLSIFGFVIQLFIFSFCYFFSNPENVEDKNLTYYMNALLMGLVFQTFAINIDNLFRMSMYFSSAGALALPSVIESMPKKQKKQWYLIIYVIFFIYMFRAGSLRHFGMFGGL